MDGWFFARWRKRTWFVVGWTAVMIASVVAVELILGSSTGSSDPPDYGYGDFARGAEDAAAGALEVGAFVLAVVVWALGFGAIRWVAWLSDELPRRRQLRALAGKRVGEQRKF
jgi:hypothetical protein